MEVLVIKIQFYSLVAHLHTFIIVAQSELHAGQRLD